MYSGKKAQHDFPKMRGGGDQRPFGTFPKIHPFWKRRPSLTPTVQKCRWWKEHLSCATQFPTNWQCFHSGHKPRRSLAPGRDGLRHPVPPAYHLNLQGGRNEDNLSFEGKTKHIQSQIEQVWKINLDGKVTRCNNSRKLHIYLTKVKSFNLFPNNKIIF